MNIQTSLDSFAAISRYVSAEASDIAAELEADMQEILVRRANRIEHEAAIAAAQIEASESPAKVEHPGAPDRNAMLAWFRAKVRYNANRKPDITVHRDRDEQDNHDRGEYYR